MHVRAKLGKLPFQLVRWRQLQRLAHPRKYLAAIGKRTSQNEPLTVQPVAK